MNNLLKIVLTGAPGSGKTIILNKLKQEKAFSDFLFFDEMARLLLEKNPRFRENWHDFHIQIFKELCKREIEAENRSFFTDRGTLDAAAFHFEIINTLKTTLTDEYRRYTHIVHLESTANLGEKYYKTDRIRIESIAKALEIEVNLKNIWGDHPGYMFIKAEKDFENKYKNLFNLILEKRRKLTNE